MQLISQTSDKKLRGGFYTPEEIVEFILRWSFNGSKTADILEPSCGDGIFLKLIKKNEIEYNSITAIELNENEAAKAERIRLRNKKVYISDFHTYCNKTEDRFDVILGNPPYIRYQYFDKDQQLEAERIFKNAGLVYSKLTNAWVSFVVGSCQLLRERGKIGFVLPAEILQVSYAKQLRKFISLNFNKINIISFEKLVFPNIQQEVIILLCEKDESSEHRIDHIEVRHLSELKSLDILKLKSPTKKIDFNSNKWTFYFLEQEEINFLDNISKNKRIPILGKYAEVEVGITTGSNDFFTVPISVVNEFGLHDYAKPAVGRSVQVSSIIFSKQDWLKNRDKNAKAHLLVFPGKHLSTKRNGANKYISLGEELGIHKGYKCEIRNDWFVVPSLKISDALFVRRNHLFPKLIINEAKAYSTDTMHRIFLRLGTNINAFIASFYNSLSFAYSEISGRSYGGGVLELMPSEVEKILLPYKKENETLVKEIDKMMREQKNIEDILKFTNNCILKKGFGLSNREIELAHNIWKKLSNRRLMRNGNSFN